MGIFNLTNIDTICAKVDKDKEIKEHYETSIQYFCGGEEAMGILGFYSTEEKAIKVLNAMQNAYASSIKLTISSDGEMQWQRVPVIFQMPEDDEV